MSRRSLRFAFPAAAAALVIAVGVTLNFATSSGHQDHPTPEQLVEALAPELPDNQAGLLTDGNLTPEEFEHTIDRTAACLEAAGFSVVRHPGEGVGGATRLEVAGDLRTMTLEQIRVGHKGCVDEHQGKLGIIWAEMNRPTAGEQAAQQQTFDACLTAAGYGYVVPNLRGAVLHPVDGPYPHGTPEWDAIWVCRAQVYGY